MEELPPELELMFIRSLLDAPIAEQRVLLDRVRGLNIFTQRGREIEWIVAQTQKSKRVPSVGSFERRFICKLPKADDSAETLFEQIASDYCLAAANNAITLAKEMMPKEGVVEAVRFLKAQLQEVGDVTTSCSDLQAGGDSAFHRYKQVVSELYGVQERVDTPWASLNTSVKWLRAGNTFIVAARTSIGKTYYVLWWANYLANKGVKTLFVTKEMSVEQLSDRVESIRYKLSHTHLVSGELDGKTLRRWQRERKENEGKLYPLLLSGSDSVSGIGLSSIQSKIEQMKPQVVFIDGAYLITPEGKAKADEVTRLTVLSRQIKAMAMATKTIIIPVIQLNRQAEKKDGVTKGALVNVYGSDAWSQDADYLMLISGKRGSGVREMDLVKARESALCQFVANFTHSPSPDFSERASSSFFATSTQTSFTGVA